MGRFSSGYQDLPVDSFGIVQFIYRRTIWTADPIWILLFGKAFEAAAKDPAAAGKPEKENGAKDGSET